jgi:peptidyl-prolyl cis-trans isomerase SurA
MIKKILFLIVIGMGFLAQSQDVDDQILMTIHDRKITVGEFERIYNKNNSNPSIEQQTVDEYLDLFINFKLKVIEAEERGMDTTQAFLREFNGYKKQLAKPYINDKAEQEVLVKEAFERSQYDIHASHILIRVDEFASPEDTLKAYQKIMQIRNRIEAGEDFSTVAMATSDDPSVRTNGGDIGWFTVFRMIYPFETAAYNTPPGKISMPVRTKYGYHIIKVHEKRPAQGEVKVAHIMVITPESMSDADRIKAKEKIDHLYDTLKMGVDFAELAKKYSEDRGSAANGGELPWFGTGRMVPEFEAAAFTITNIGDYTAPVQTAFGWHIIKLLDKKGVDDFERMKPDLESMVAKSDRIASSRKAMIQRIKAQYNFKESPSNLGIFYTLVDTTIFSKGWTIPDNKNMDRILFTIGNTNYTCKDFALFLRDTQGGRPMDIRVYVNNKYNEFIDKSVLEYEENQLPLKYPEFKYLVQEYHDGILLFDLTDKMVWSKAVKDSSGLQEFYEKNKKNYMWESDRLNATIYTCTNETVANKARSLLTKKSKKSIGPAQLVQSVIQTYNDSTCINYETGIFEKGENKWVDSMDWKVNISPNINDNGKVIFVVKNRIVKPEPKKLDEARGLVTADYQAYLEKLWIQELRNKYKVEVDQELLAKIRNN